MADWGSGYVTDTAYVHDFCRVQTPPMLALAALSGGVEALYLFPPLQKECVS